MDTDKYSNPSKGPELSNVMAPEETALGDKSDRQKEEDREADADTPDGSVAVLSASQRRAQEKHRYNTVGYQKKKHRAAVDFSTVSKGTGVKSRVALKQALFSQGTSDKNGTGEERSGSGLVDTLKQVLDFFCVPEDLSWTWGDGGTERMLEKSWTDIVRNHESMSKTQRHQQEALWELLHTELTYINKLTIAKELVLAALAHCQIYGFLQEISSTMLFSNLPSILEAHQLFWHEVMYPMLQEVRLTGRPFDPLKLEVGCLQFPDRFPAYFEYCLEEERNVDFTRRQLETNPHFHTYLTWVENHPQCGRMRLGDMQAKPHQRITKYPLLLKAVQKTTQDLPTQNALNRMEKKTTNKVKLSANVLNSVNNFLESINGYLQLKEDSLALSAAAQRIEGYKIESVSEEIDEQIRQFCCFDLTSPMRGVGPNFIRKQLLEDTLKIRKRKDTKELVVLLFTDVLLMTKTQKKSDKLKVVRPPLPLERIHCIELKDGYSFMLVEVGDLGCAVSVNCLSTPSPESCASWVSALRETQAALDTLRKNETNNILKTLSKTCLDESDKMADKVVEDADGQSVSDSDLDPAETEGQFISPTTPSDSENDPAECARSIMPEQQMQTPKDPISPPIGQQNEVAGQNDRITEEGRHRNNSKQWEEEEAPFRKISERRVTWKHGEPAASNLNPITQQDLTGRSQPNGHHLMPGGHVEKVDTIQTISSTSLSNKPQMSISENVANVDTGESVHLHPDDDSQEIGRNSSCSQSGEEEGFLTESGRFSRKLNSPRLRRRRLNNGQPSTPSDSPGTDVKQLEFTTNTNTSLSQRRASNPCIKPQDSPHRVLKLGSIKNNHGILWNVTDKKSTDPEMLFEPERIPDGTFQMKPIKLKTQRSSSIPEISSSQSLLLSHRRSPSSSPQLPSSPLQSLQRAKEREKGRGLGKRQGKEKEHHFSVQNSAQNISASPSLSVREGENEARPGMTSAHGWSEGNVDGFEDDMKESSNALEGTSVDWPGWCFDDEEFFDFEHFEDEDWLEQLLPRNELRRSERKPSERQDDSEWSEV